MYLMAAQDDDMTDMAETGILISSMATDGDSG